MSTALVRPLQRIERLCGSASDADALAGELGAAIADQVEADAFCFMRTDPLTALWLHATDAGFPAAACRDYVDRAFMRSPWADLAGAARQDDRVGELVRGDAAPDDYGKVFLHDYGFERQLHVSYAFGGQSFGYLILARRSGGFAAESQRFLRQTVPGITGGLRRLLAKETMEAVPGEQVALLLVDADGRMAPANAAGGALIADLPDPAVRERSGLSTIARLAARRLREGSAEPVPRVVWVHPGSRQRYRLVAERMLGGAVEQVLLMAEPIRALDSVELLRAAGLTEREAEVALTTLRGLRSSEGALALGMSEHTYLGHLKSLYRKLNVGSRGELAAVLLSGR